MLDHVASYVDRFVPRVLKEVEFPHFMEAAVPDRLAQELEAQVTVRRSAMSVVPRRVGACLAVLLLGLLSPGTAAVAGGDGDSRHACRQGPDDSRTPIAHCLVRGRRRAAGAGVAEDGQTREGTFEVAADGTFTCTYGVSDSYGARDVGEVTIGVGVPA